MADPFGRASFVRGIPKIRVDRERTPRKETAETVRALADYLDRLSPEEIAALLEDSVDEEPPP